MSNDIGHRSSEPTAFEYLLDSVARFAAAYIALGWRAVAYPVVGAGVGVVIALMTSNQYTSTASFVAHGSSGSSIPSNLQSLAASFGIDRSPDFSPKFYADLLRSRPVLTSAVQHHYRVTEEAPTERLSYLAIEGFDEGPASADLETAIRHLSRLVAANADVRTNIVTLSVRARWPWLAHDIAETLLMSLDSLNIQFRQEQSREMREFYETRVSSAQNELDAAESALEEFHLRNRMADSPLLAFEQMRLERDVDMKRTLYTALVQQFEQARLQEARNVPTISMLAQPHVPVKKSAPARRGIVVAFTLLGLVALWVEQVLISLLRRLKLAALQRSESRA